VKSPQSSISTVRGSAVLVEIDSVRYSARHAEISNIEPGFRWSEREPPRPARQST
jgi:hypothetical protein